MKSALTAASRTATALLFTSVLASAAFGADAKYAAGSYQIDAMHSKVGFEISHLVISSVEGKFNKSEGEIKLDPS
ncbi:MAG: hypothetical protein EOP05_22345, partial [Proteobacteria bacterium]